MLVQGVLCRPAPIRGIRHGRPNKPILDLDPPRCVQGPCTPWRVSHRQNRSRGHHSRRRVCSMGSRSIHQPHNWRPTMRSSDRAFCRVLRRNADPDPDRKPVFASRAACCAALMKWPGDSRSGDAPGLPVPAIASGDLDVAVVGQLPAANLPLGNEFEPGPVQVEPFEAPFRRGSLCKQVWRRAILGSKRGSSLV
jgi:hypothetical protein